MQTEQLEGFKLSPQQKHLWLLQESENTLPYRVKWAVTVSGNLNLEILKTALRNVVNKYEILRTNFHCLTGMIVPLQVIADTSKINIYDFNLTSLPSKEQENRIESIYTELTKRPFKHRNNIPFHVNVTTLSPIKHILMLSLSALIADSFTLKKLLGEISRSYGACLEDKHIFDEPMQYADIAEWQNDILESNESELGKEYWRDRDVSSSGHLKLWFEKKQSIISQFQPRQFSLQINNDLSKQLELLANTYKVNKSDFLLVFWLILLWKINRRSDITIGITANGRKYEELEQALGPLSKVLPFSHHLEAEFKFSETLNKINELVNDAYELQEYFTWQENSSSESFCPVGFEYEEYLENYSAGNLSFSLDELYSCTDKFKIKLSCLQKNDTLIAQFYYDPELYNLQDIQTLSEQFQNLLASAVENPESSIGRLNILSDRQRKQLLVEFNNTQKQYPQDKCIHKIFEEQAKQTPNKNAVVFEEQQLTYSELNTRANQLANYLQSQGVKPGVLVGIYLERSPEIVIAILGILKAGGAYLPLDPSLPVEGLAYRIKDAQTPVILTQESLVNKIPDLKTKIVSINADCKAIARQKTDKPNDRVTSKDLAYVLFTSGSTGKPKGVAVEHQQLSNYLNAIEDRLNLTVCNQFAIVSTFAADLGNTVIFPALCTGGCLHVLSSEYASNPETVADYFHRHSIDCLKIVPSHLNALLTSSRPERILPKKRLILGGEACPWQLIERIKQLSPECSIFNHYGPTEATVGVLTYPIELESTTDSGTVPLGRPIANTQIYILDSCLQSVPIGVPGELYIGGAGVARCYLNRHDLTNEKFISNPFAETKEVDYGQRLYKTGDLARYLVDGNIEFIGRIDNQVKIHGFRIELGEIESALRQHSLIRETVVLAREDRSGNKYLAAYVVPEQQFSLTTAELKEFLREKLPHYMIPSSFMRLKALPLLPNGKVNRQELPEPDRNSDLSATFVAPRTSAEKALSDIWAKILKLEQVGIYNNFFELGGDSILSMQVIAKANQAGLRLTPRQFFEHQTIAELAAVASTNKKIQAEQGLVTGSAPFTPIQSWFFEQNFPQMHHWNQSVLLEVRQPFDPVLLTRALQQLLKHHDALRLRYIRQKTGWQQVNADFEEVVPFTWFDLSTMPESEQKSAISTIATTLQSSFNLTDGLLLRIALFDLGSTKSQRLLIIIHHLVTDGVSWRILIEDLQTAYQQLSQGEAIALPSKTTSFKQWAERLPEYVRSQLLPQELNYWSTKILQQQSIRLPVDFPNGENTVALAETISMALSQQETKALLQEVSTAYQTQINDVLLTALVYAVGEWIGSRSLSIALEGHGREEIFDDVDLSRTIGWFSTIFPVFLDLRDAKEIEAELKTVKTQLRDIPNRGIGYGLLRYLGGDRAASLQDHTSKAEIRFNYLGQSDQLFEDSSLFLPAHESTGTQRSSLSSRSYLLDINGIVTGGQLEINWTYSKAIHYRATIESVAEKFMEKLREIIAHCQSRSVEKHLSGSGTVVSPQIEKPITTSKITLEVLNNEAVLDSTILPDTSFKYPNNPSHIFLTGATGFVGAFLLSELLQQTNATIYCLIRATDVESGMNKLQRHLESYLVWDKCLSNRIIPVIGDLSQPLLGLSEQQYQVMAQIVDVIYHNAASINLVYPYSTLKACNVLGTQEILRLASQIKVKPVHYISTLSVLSSEDHVQVKNIEELNKFSHSQIPSGGYAQTKWVAEKLVAVAHNRGIPGSIYRLGRVSGHSKTGVCNTSDRLYRMFKGFIQLKCAPDVNTTVDMTPVDYISSAIVHLSKQEQSLNKIFHLSNHQPIGSLELFNWIREFGYSLESMSYDRWQTELINASESSPDNPLYPLIPFFAGKETEDKPTQESSKHNPNSAELKLDCQNTIDGLADTSIVCPPVDTKLLTTYFSCLIESSFLTPPQQIPH